MLTKQGFMLPFNEEMHQMTVERTPASHWTSSENAHHHIVGGDREENTVAMDLITQHIRMKLQQPDLRRVYHNLEVIPSTSRHAPP